MTGFRLEPIGAGPRCLVTPDRPLVLGRSPQCDVVVADPSVSRRHAEFRVTDGALVVRDLGSANGTLVNGQRSTEARLVPGDVVELGGGASPSACCRSSCTHPALGRPPTGAMTCLPA